VTLRPSRFLLPRDRVLASQGKQRAGLTTDQQTGHFSVFMDRTFLTVTDNWRLGPETRFFVGGPYVYASDAYFGGLRRFLK
jgi:hypothetical protein